MLYGQLYQRLGRIGVAWSEPELTLYHNEEYAEHDIDMGSSYAYSDSVSDLPMLRSVGNAVVVNPDSELLSIAKAEGWRVLQFERLGRKMAIAAGTALAAAGGTLLASRRRSRPRGRLARR